MIFLSAPPLFSGRLSTGLRLCLWIAQIPKCPQKWKGVLRGLRRMGGLWMVKGRRLGGLVWGRGFRGFCATDDSCHCLWSAWYFVICVTFAIHDDFVLVLVLVLLVSFSLCVGFSGPPKSPWPPAACPFIQVTPAPLFCGILCAILPFLFMECSYSLALLLDPP